MGKYRCIVGVAGGDLSGNYPNPVVSKIQGIAVNNTAPVANNVLTATSTTSAQWKALPISSIAILSYQGFTSVPAGFYFYLPLYNYYGPDIGVGGANYLTILNTGVYKVSYMVFISSGTLNSNSISVRLNSSYNLPASQVNLPVNTNTTVDFFNYFTAGDIIGLYNSGSSAFNIGNGGTLVAASFTVQKVN